MRMLRFVVYSALALALADRAAAVGAGAGASVLREVQAPDLSRRQDNFSPNSVNTFTVSADLRPAASVVRPADQRPVFGFPQRQQQQQPQVVSRPPLPPQAGPPVRPPGGPQIRPQGGPQIRPQDGPQDGPQTGPQFRPQVDQSLQRPISPASNQPVLDKSPFEVREINPPFLQQYNEDGTIYQRPPPTAPQPSPPQQQQFRRPPQQQQFRRPPQKFRRPRPPFGRLPPPPRPGRPLRRRQPIFQGPLQQLQQRIFRRPPARGAPHRRRSRRDVTSDVAAEVADEVSPDVKQDRLGRWEMEYVMRKAADPASFKEHEAVPPWAPLKPEARARLAQLAEESSAPRSTKQAQVENGDLPITVTEVVADSPEAARIPISPGDEVVIIRVPEEELGSESFSIETPQLLSHRDGRAQRVDSVASARQGRSDDNTGRSDQPWWARIPLLNRLIYREMPGEESTPGYTPSGEATQADPTNRDDPTNRAGYDPETFVTTHFDPYLSVDGSGRPYYRTPIHAELANYEHIPDMAKPVLNPTEEFVVPDNIEDPFRGGYAPFRPGYQYVSYVPYLPSPYYPPGDVKYHRRQQLIPSELNYAEYTQKKREDESAEAAARNAETVVKAVEVESDKSDLERVLAQAAQERTGKISIIDTGDHYAVISGDINKFVDFDGEQAAPAKSTKAHRSLTDLLKLSESSDAVFAPHSRIKRQAGLYSLLAPVRRRPQRRPIQRRDDVGRFPPRAPAFRPPWESGRRVPGRPRGPRPLRPVSQRPNTRQPTTAFQPPVPRSVFEQYEARPVFDQPQERPVFEQHEERPSFEQHNAHPSFEQPQERPTFESFDARPSFEQPAAQPEFEQPASRPTLHQPAAQPEFEQPAARPTFHQPASRPTVEQPGNNIITGPPAQFGGFQPVTGPVRGADLQLSGSPVVHEASPQDPPRPVVSPLRQDASRRTVVTTVPTPIHTAAVHVHPSRPVSQPIQPATRVVTDRQPAPPQQQFASSERHQQVVVRSSISSQSPVTDNQLTEEADKPNGSWASAALAGLSAILGGSQETPTTESVHIAAPTAEVPAPAVTRLPQQATERHSSGVAHQNHENAPKSKDGIVYAKDAKAPEAAPQNTAREETHKEQLKDKPAAKVVKRYRKRQRRPSSSASVSSTSYRGNPSRRTNSPTVIHRRREPTVAPIPATDSGAAASHVKPAVVSAPKRRVPFGARVRPTAGQHRRRPVARRPTPEPEPIPAPTTPTTQEQVTAAASQLVRQPVRRLPTEATVTDERVEASAPIVAVQKPTLARQTPAPRPAPTQQTTQPTTKEPEPTAAPEQQETVSVEVPSRGGFRPVAGPPRHHPAPPSRGRPAVHRVTTPAVPQPNDVDDVPLKTRQEESKAEQARPETEDDKKEKEDEEENGHSQLENYLSRYAEKYGLGLVTSSPVTKRPTPAGRPAAPVSGLRWAHLTARSRSPAPVDADDKLDEFAAGETDGDERVSVGSQYSYRVQLPPSRRVPPSLNSVRLRSKSKLAQLLGSSPRLRPSTAKPTIPWPAGYQPFTVSSTTPRLNRWAARRERLTTPTPTPAPSPTTGPAWSKYADEFTTTQRPSTESPAPSVTRYRPIFIPPNNRKRIRTRPLTRLHAGTRRPATTTTATTTTEQPPVVQTEELTEPPAVTLPAPPPVTEQISPELDTVLEEKTEATTDSWFADEDEEDPLVASSEEPLGESSLFSVVYSKERPHVPPPQPEIFSRLNQFLVSHGEQPPTAPATVTVTVGTSPIRVPVPVPADTQNGPGEFQDSVQVVPVEPYVPESLDEAAETEESEEQALVTPDGAVIVQAVPAEAVQPAGNGAWVPTVQAVALAPAVVAASPQPGTVVVYPEHMSQVEREAHWPARQVEPQPEEEEEQGEWFEEPESGHDLALSDDDLLEEVVYISDEDYRAALGKAARLDDEAASEAEFLLPVATDATAADEESDSDEVEVPRPVHDPYGVFWTSPSGATNAEQAESQHLAGAFAADADEADIDGAVDDAPDAQAEPSGEAEEEDRTVNLCLDGKCMFIYEPGRQVQVNGEN